MRRSACFLAVLGLSVQGAIGQDVMKPESARPRTTGQSLQFYAGARQQEPEPEKAATRFTRRSVTEESKSDSELRNYYRELFGEAAPATQAAAATPVPQADAEPQSRTRLKPVSAVDTPKSNVIHAEYQKDPFQPESAVIHPVKAEASDARPFPGAAESPFDVPPKSANQPKPRTSLTEPISISKDMPAADAVKPATSQPFASQTDGAAEAREMPRAGSLTISRKPATSAATQASTAVTEQAGAGVQTPSVSIEWVKRSEINVGQECRCDLVIKNPGAVPVQQMVIEAHFPSSVRLVKAAPQPSHTQGHLGWDVDELKPGEERTIEVTMIPLQRGAIATRANVRFSGTAHGAFSVSEPLLAVNIEGPSKVLIGEAASHTVTVSNPGTGIATNVQLEARIPAGLEHARGERLMMELGSLNPGESRSVRLALAATKGGSHQIDVQARADSGLSRTAASGVQVVAPSLTAEIAGPGLRYLGRQGTFTLTVANDGAAATDNVRLMHKIPEGFDFVSADRGAQFDPATRLLTWFVGRLDQNQKLDMKVTLTAKTMGEFKHLVRATSEHGSLSDAELTTAVEGASSLAVELVDLDDPVEVGTEAIYEVRVKNTGTAAARNVALACELEPGMKLIAAHGPAQHVAENGVIVYQAISELQAGQTSVFRVHVAAEKAGNMRFRTRLTSESVEQPLTNEELTKFYGE